MEWYSYIDDDGENNTNNNNNNNDKNLNFWRVWCIKKWKIFTKARVE